MYRPLIITPPDPPERPPAVYTRPGIHLRWTPELRTRVTERASRLRVSRQFLIEQLIIHGLNLLDDQDRAGTPRKGTNQS